jgi:sialic acid synthase SpsE
MQMRFDKEILVNDRSISFKDPTYFIADIAANHDGDLGRAKELIFMASEAGADAVKFQHFKADTIVSDYGFKQLGNQLSHQSKWKKSVYEVYETASIDIGWTSILKETSEKANIDFFTSPYSLALVDAVEPYIPAFKIGSGDINFIEIIDHISKKGKPVFIASGASGIDDVERAISAILQHNRQIVLMQCNTNYTGDVSNFKNINLNVLNTYKEKYPGMILGLSDHTPGHSTVLGAIALGARVVEKHFTDSNSRPGPDHKFSMTPSSWKEMVVRSKELELALGDGIKRIEENEKETVYLQRRCLRLTRDLAKGETLKKSDLEALRPAIEGALAPFEIDEIIGTSIIEAKTKGDALYKSDLNIG